MSAKYIHKCDRCGYAVSTSGPWEFYRDSRGHRKDYGHPVPVSQEAKQRGIYGLSGDLYCANCDRVFDLILVEFKRPRQDSLSARGDRREPKDEFIEEGSVKCPLCGSANLILKPQGDKVVTCPRCKEGKMTGEMGWIC